MGKVVPDFLLKKRDSLSRFLASISGVWPVVLTKTMKQAYD